jgi:hypothetical protein
VCACLRERESARARERESERESEREREHMHVYRGPHWWSRMAEAACMLHKTVYRYIPLYTDIYIHTHTGGHIGVGQWQNGIQIQGPGYPGNVCVYNVGFEGYIKEVLT